MGNKKQKRKRRILIADSGSTKTDWCLLLDDQVIKFTTSGMNAAIQSEEQLRTIVETELMPVIAPYMKCRFLPHELLKPTHIYFYGAGCVGENSLRMSNVLNEVFDKRPHISVNSDIAGAAIALLGKSKGIACVLGTGSNSCLFDGKRIVKQIPPLGYILGDEGSGAVLGRRFLNALFKSQLPNRLRQEFMETTNLSLADIQQNVYREADPNCFLASFSPFISRHLRTKAVEELVVDNFRDFITKNIVPYRHPELPINAVGSIAWAYKEQLCKAAEMEGMTVGKILKSPMDELIEYHLT